MELRKQMFTIEGIYACGIKGHVHVIAVWFQNICFLKVVLVWSHSQEIKPFQIPRLN